MDQHKKIKGRLYLRWSDYLFDERDSRRTQIPICRNKLIGCQGLTSTLKGCKRQSVMSRPQYEQKSLIDHNAASDKLSKEKKKFTLQSDVFI